MTLTHHFAGTPWGEGAFSSVSGTLPDPVDGRGFLVRVHLPGVENPDTTTIDFTVGLGRLPDPPSGIGSQTLRILQGKTESQPYGIRVADPGGELTGLLFADGRFSAVGRWAEILTRLDGGPWERIDLRRITRGTSPDPVTWEFELTTDVSLLRDVLFARSNDVQLYPLGPRRAWHRHPAAGFASPFDLGTPGKVLAVSGDAVRIQLAPIAVPRELVGVVRDELDGLRMETNLGTFPVLSFGDTATPADLDEAVGIWLDDPPTLPAAVWVDMPGHSLAVDGNVGALRLWWPDGVPTSEVTPYLVGPAIDRLTGEVAGDGYRLDALVRDVFRGTYGGRRMLFDDGAVSELGDLGDEGQWYAFPAPVARGDFLREHVWRAYLLAPAPRADGALAPLSVWAGDARPVSGLYVFNGSNVSPEGVRYSAGGNEVANVWSFNAQHADPRLPAPAAIFPRLDLVPVTRTRRAEGATLVDEPYALDLGAAVMRREWSRALPDLYSARVFALAADGVVTYDLNAAVEDASPIVGQFVVLRMAELRAPEAQSATRTGDRIAVVVERARTYSGGRLFYRYLLWDAGWRAHSVAHADTAHADTHSDSGAGGHFDAHVDEHIDIHTDVGHADTHSDSGHSDVHNDAAHADSHSDSAAHTDAHVDSDHADAHTDVMHSDNHVDSAHSDSHGDSTWLSDGEHCDSGLADGDPCFHSDTHGDSAHADSHSDTPHTDDHTDAAHDDQHGDISHSDSHSDGAHTDAHSDTSHGDTHADGDHSDTHADLPHTDLHQDGSHEDSHADSAHTDWHDDTGHSDSHTDAGHTDSHTDSDHTDSHGDSAPHSDTHEDVPHDDAHGDDSHSDSHGDTAGGAEHADTHQDLAHVDDHTDVPHDDSHTDTSHADTHEDVPFQNFHDDVTGVKDTIDDPHCDAGMVDGIACHSDFHGDSVHSDTHSDVGHTDLHDDVTHEDVHSDTAHLDDHDDVPVHDDIHGDDSHLDSHDDTAHDDAHEDFAHDDGHADAGHDDTHVDSEHTDIHADGDHTDAHRDQVHSDVHADAGVA